MCLCAVWFKSAFQIWCHPFIRIIEKSWTIFESFSKCSLFLNAPGVDLSWECRCTYIPDSNPLHSIPVRYYALSPQSNSVCYCWLPNLHNENVIKNNYLGYFLGTVLYIYITYSGTSHKQNKRHTVYFTFLVFTCFSFSVLYPYLQKLYNANLVRVSVNLILCLLIKNKSWNKIK